MAKPDLARTPKSLPEDTDADLSAMPREDLEERCRALSVAVQEKEHALRELQHRAKNSLQLVISLLRLQHHRISDPGARMAYDQTMFRVEVLAVLYRQVHETRSETQVQLQRYTQEVVETAVQNIGDLPAPVQVEVRAAPGITTSLYTAMPYGLILNELVMAALRNAYPSNGRMEVMLEKIADGHARLNIRGNGRALPPGFDAEADAAQMLVEALATQLGADLDIRTTPSHAVSVTFQL